MPVVLARMGVIGDESLVKMRTNTCLSYTSAVPSYSVPGSGVLTFLLPVSYHFQ